MQIDYTTLNQIKTADVRTLPSLFAPGQHVSREDVKPTSPYPAIVTYSGHHDIVIPGLGQENLKLKCGALLGFTICRNCGKLSTYVDHCESVYCPVCSSRVMRRSVKNATQRLHGFMRLNDLRVNPRHYVVSGKGWDEMTYKQVVESWHNIRKRHLPMLSGVAVFHPYRIRDEIKGRLRDLDDSGYHGFWDAVKADALGLGDFFEYVVWSPHYHVLGWGKLPRSDWLYIKTGIVYKTKSTRSFEFVPVADGFGYTSDVMRTLSYLVTHAGVNTEQKRHVLISGIGACSKNRLKETEYADYTVKKDIFCPKCQSYDIERVCLVDDGLGGYRVSRSEDLPPFVWVWKRFKGVDK